MTTTAAVKATARVLLYAFGFSLGYVIGTIR